MWYQKALFFQFIGGILNLADFWQKNSDFKPTFWGIIPNQCRRDKHSENQLIFARFLILIKLKLDGNYWKTRLYLPNISLPNLKPPNVRVPLHQRPKNIHKNHVLLFHSNLKQRCGPNLLSTIKYIKMNLMLFNSVLVFWD